MTRPTGIREKARELRLAGFSEAAIARKFGVSRQRVCKLCEDLAPVYLTPDVYAIYTSEAARQGITVDALLASLIDTDGYPDG